LLLEAEAIKVTAVHSQRQRATHIGLAVLFCVAGEAVETATTAVAHLLAVQGLAVEQVVMVALEVI
jgi:hypothetical protein